MNKIELAMKIFLAMCTLQNTMETYKIGIDANGKESIQRQLDTQLET